MHNSCALTTASLGSVVEGNRIEPKIRGLKIAHGFFLDANKAIELVVDKLDGPEKGFPYCTS